MMDYSPLVSVTVCTYNSSKTVLETLESIKLQTYRNIELVISDDDSKDDSVQICKKWIDENNQRFIRCHVLTHSKNTGTSANSNRAIKESEGEWIKVVAADDKLLPNCITDFVDFANNRPNSSFIFSKVVVFGNLEAARSWPWANVKKYFDEFTSRQIRIILSFENFLPAASAFFKRSLWTEVGGYDETIPLIDDWPFLIKVVSKGINLDFLNKETAAYRFSESSISLGIKPVSQKYKDNVIKARIYARKSLKNINILYYYLYQSRRLLRWRHPIVIHIVRLLNLFNPALYEYEKTVSKFNKIRSEWSNQ